MQLKPIGHNCPVCKSKVFGYRKTRRYCTDTCKAKHHLLAKKQLKERLLQLDSKNYKSLKTRNLYLCEGLIGPIYSKAVVSLKSLKTYKFQLTEAIKSQGFKKPKIYTIGNYKYWIKGANLHIERTADSPEYEIGFYERWLLEYPDKEFYIEVDQSDAALKKNILGIGGVWRE